MYVVAHYSMFTDELNQVIVDADTELEAYIKGYIAMCKTSDDPWYEELKKVASVDEFFDNIAEEDSMSVIKI